MCLHFGEQGGCFYGGVMQDEVYPAVRAADALVLLCPNYNDALSANRMPGRARASRGALAVSMRAKFWGR